MRVRQAERLRCGDDQDRRSQVAVTSTVAVCDPRVTVQRNTAEYDVTAGMVARVNVVVAALGESALIDASPLIRAHE